MLFLGKHHNKVVWGMMRASRQGCAPTDDYGKNTNCKRQKGRFRFKEKICKANGWKQKLTEFLDAGAAYSSSHGTTFLSSHTNSPFGDLM